MKSILDRTFDYTPAAATDLKKTFARIRREQRAQNAAPVRAGAEAATSNITPMRELIRKRLTA